MATATLDEFIYLNKELAALARAGMPLDRGLAMLGAESPGKAGRLANAIAERVEAGEPLEKAIADEQMPLPTLYRSVISAGVRSGRLAEALQSVAESAARIARLRSASGLAMLYPLTLFLLAYLMGSLILRFVIPDMLLTMEMMGAEPPAVAAAISRFWIAAGWWILVPPIVVTFAFLLWWYVSGRANSLLASRFTRSRGVVHRSRLAIFCELMGLMTDHGVPLDQAITLAAGGTGNRTMAEAAARWSEAYRAGRIEKEALRNAGFPPLITWLLGSGGDQAALTKLFRQASQTYERQAARAAYWISFTLPMIFTGLIGGSIAIIYGLMFFLPWMSLLHRLSEPVHLGL